jgi:hypothetical protein
MKAQREDEQNEFEQGKREGRGLQNKRSNTDESSG